MTLTLQGKSPEDIAQILEEDDEMEQVHESAAQEGQSAVDPEDVEVDTHFVCFM